jgi:hypothetical protein
MSPLDAHKERIVKGPPKNIKAPLPVIPPRNDSDEVKGSPNSGHIASTLRRCLDEQPVGYSRHDIYFTKYHPSMRIKSASSRGLPSLNAQSQHILSFLEW